MTEKAPRCRNKMVLFSVWMFSSTSLSVCKSSPGSFDPRAWEHLPPRVLYTTPLLGHNRADQCPHTTLAHTMPWLQPSSSKSHFFLFHHSFNVSVFISLLVSQNPPNTGLSMRGKLKLWLLVVIAKTTSLNILFLLSNLFFPPLSSSFLTSTDPSHLP